MNTGLFHLRCIQVGLNIGDLELMTLGMVFDIFNEQAKDKNGFTRRATQDDFDAFAKL